MPDFAYTARDAKGLKVTGSVAAQSEREAVATLTGRSLFPIEVKADKAAIKAASSKRVSGQTMAGISGQMSTLLRSGVSMLRTLAVLRDQTSNKTLKLVLEDVHARVEEGNSLADAMSRYPRVFSEISVNMVRAGSEGGFLEDALERIAQFTEQQEDLKGRTVGALAYPVILAVIGTLVVSVLVIFFVPMFAEIFQQLRDKNELPILTDILLFISDTLRGYGLLILLVLVGASVLVRARLQTDEGRLWLDTWKLRLPLAGPILRSLAVSRFCRVLGTMLKNGVPILKSLDISREAAGNRVLSLAIAGAAENITAGQSLAKPLAASKEFPQTVVEMIAVAEESNSLDRVLVEVANSLETRTVRQLDLMVRLLEPLMLMVLAGIVLCVVIALLMPIIRMSQTI
jgi:general secretion pathway protein F/type IV pilus assembly protein PilC